jgi:hypothetical protein
VYGYGVVPGLVSRYFYSAVPLGAAYGSDDSENVIVNQTGRYWGYHVAEIPETLVLQYGPAECAQTWIEDEWKSH